MANSVQTIKCGWTGCAQRFGSEIDMNMHVIMNHMVILDHGEFVMNRRVPNRKRPAREVEALVEDTVAEKPAKNRQPAGIPVVPPQKPQNPVGNSGIPRTIGNAIPSTNLEIPGTATENPLPAAIKQEFDDDDDFRTKSEGPGPSGVRNHKEGVEEREMSQNPGEGAGDITIREQNEINLEELLQLQPPPRAIDVVDDILERLRPMKQLGFIRPNKTVYCIVCLKYVRSFHECNWKHTPEEDRVAEMWYRRFGPDKSTGKAQLMRELEEIKFWMQSEEDGVILQDNPQIDLSVR